MVRTHAPIHIEDLPAGELTQGTTMCGKYFNIEEQLPVIVIQPEFLYNQEQPVLPSCQQCWKGVVEQTITEAGTHHC